MGHLLVRCRFFGSRYDDINNFGNRTLDEVATDLAAVATAVAKVILVATYVRYYLVLLCVLGRVQHFRTKL